MDQLAPIIVVLVLPPMALAILYFAAHFGGWAALATQFQEHQSPSGRTFRFCSGSVGRANYGLCLRLIVSDLGLHMSVLLPFRFAHPPLLIPWSAFHNTRKKKFLFWSVTETSVGTPVIAHLTLAGWLADYICEDGQTVDTV